MACLHGGFSISGVSAGIGLMIAPDHSRSSSDVMGHNPNFLPSIFIAYLVTLYLFAIVSTPSVLGRIRDRFHTCNCSGSQLLREAFLLPVGSALLGVPMG